MILAQNNQIQKTIDKEKENEHKHLIRLAPSQVRQPTQEGAIGSWGTWLAPTLRQVPLVVLYCSLQDWLRNNEASL